MSAYGTVAIMVAHAISVDDEDSWPGQVLRLFEQSVAALQDQAHWKDELEKRLADGDDNARWSPPFDPFRDQVDTALDEIDHELVKHRVVGFHCCRFLDSEKKLVLRDGMRTLSPQLVGDRIKLAVAEGCLSSEQARVLESHALLNETRGSRLGLAWFIFGRTTFQTHKSNLHYLLDQWGGEAIYFSEAGIGLEGVLAKIGRPTVVEAEIPVPDLELFPRLSERLRDYYLWRRATKAGPSGSAPAFEGYTKRDLPGTLVRRVLTEGDEAFEELTRYSTWED